MGWEERRETRFSGLETVANTYQHRRGGRYLMELRWQLLVGGEKERADMFWIEYGLQIPPGPTNGMWWRVLRRDSNMLRG